MYCCVDKKAVEVIDPGRSCVHFAVQKAVQLVDSDQHKHVDSDQLMELVPPWCAMKGTCINEIVL